MRLCTFSYDGSRRLGATFGSSVVDVAGAAQALGKRLPEVDGLRGLVEGGPDVVRAVEDVVAAAGEGLDPAWTWPVGQVTLHHPYRPRKNIVRAGGNTARKPGAPDVAKVTLPPGRWLAGFPIAYYTKAPTAVLDPGQPISWPLGVAAQVYAEPQLVVVVGETISYADPEEALGKVFGYAVATDVTAFDLRLKHGQWVKAGSLDSFFPWGPAIVTSDEVPDPAALDVILELNGEVAVSGSTADALLSVGEVLAELSTGIRLEPGDLLMLGTPECPGFGQSPPRWLAGGDIVTSTVQGVDSITNPVQPISDQRASAPLAARRQPASL